MRALFPVILALALLPFAAATHPCAPQTSVPDVDTGATPAGRLYVTGLVCSIFWDLVECGGIWIYEESNGITGLQRRDEVVDDTCHGLIAGDSILF